uniref:Uncharacterized protein n=1 Tax=Amphimedon queenslandica TaxID=400682 RepID=A0A1X7U7F4_AMPQE
FFVHFDRLKPYTQSTHLTTLSSSHSTPSQSSYRIGKNITLLDLSDNESSDDDAHGAPVNPPTRC